jgi:hypothetical protein
LLDSDPDDDDDEPLLVAPPPFSTVCVGVSFCVSIIFEIFDAEFEFDNDIVLLVLITDWGCWTTIVGGCWGAENEDEQEEDAEAVDDEEISMGGYNLLVLLLFTIWFELFVHVVIISLLMGVAGETGVGLGGS